MGKSSINGPFSMAMLNYQRVYDMILLHWADEREFVPTFLLAFNKVPGFCLPNKDGFLAALAATLRETIPESWETCYPRILR